MEYQDHKIKSGEVVELKSGGQRMTTGKINDDGTAICYWFDRTQTYNVQSIHLAALVKVALPPL